MPATRPPRSAVRAAVRAGLADLAPGDRILVAVSGGPDSLALLAATVVVAAERGLVSGTVIVDHGLQPGSAEVAARAAEQARILGCSDVEVVAVQVATGPGGGGVEAAARAARYAAFERAAAGVVASLLSSDGSSDDASHRRPAGSARPPTGAGRPPASAVLLGHTRDDQAETVLLGLARGSGTRSLAGMPARAGLYRRPLLGLPRAVVVAAAAEAAREDPRLEPWTDPHNADPGFARVRVRTEVLPVLERALGPGIAEALARTAGLAREDADALDGWAEREWTARVVAAPPEAQILPEGSDPPRTRGGSLPLGRICGDGLPAAIVNRLVRRWLITCGCPGGALTAQHVRGVAALLEGPVTAAEIALPGGLRARREGGALVVRA